MKRILHRLRFNSGFDFYKR